MVYEQLRSPDEGPTRLLLCPSCVVDVSKCSRTKLIALVRRDDPEVVDLELPVVERCYYYAHRYVSEHEVQLSPHLFPRLHTLEWQQDDRYQEQRLLATGWSDAEGRTRHGYYRQRQSAGEGPAWQFKTRLTAQKLAPGVKSVHCREYECAPMASVLSVEAMPVTVLRAKCLKGVHLYKYITTHGTRFEAEIDDWSPVKEKNTVAYLMCYLGYNCTLRALTGPVRLSTLRGASARAVDAPVEPIDGAAYVLKSDGIRVWILSCYAVWAVYNPYKPWQKPICLIPAPNCESCPCLALDCERLRQGKQVVYVCIDVLESRRRTDTISNRTWPEVRTDCANAVAECGLATPALTLLLRTYYSSLPDALHHHLHPVTWHDHSDGVIALVSASEQYRLKPRPTVELVVCTDGQLRDLGNSTRPWFPAYAGARVGTIVECQMVLSADGQVECVVTKARPDKGSPNTAAVVDQAHAALVSSHSGCALTIKSLSLSQRSRICSMLPRDCVVIELRCSRLGSFPVLRDLCRTVLFVDSDADAVREGSQKYNVPVIDAESAAKWLRLNYAGQRSCVCDIQQLLSYMRYDAKNRRDIHVLCLFSLQHVWAQLLQTQWPVYGTLYDHRGMTSQDAVLTADGEVGLARVGSKVVVRVCDVEHVEPFTDCTGLMAMMPRSTFDKPYATHGGPAALVLQRMVTVFPSRL